MPVGPSCRSDPVAGREHLPVCHDGRVAAKRRPTGDEVIDVPAPRPAEIRQLPGGRLPLAHMLPRPCTWVLAGGGAHGAVQLGALQALAETDATPQSLLGTSAGALTGAVYAEDPVAGPSRLSYVWANLGLGDVVTDGWWGLVRPTSLTKPSLADSSGERASLEAILSARDFSELQVPFGAVATDITSGEPKVLETGAIIPALLASSAIPGVLPPVEIDGRWYMDGLASANMPASIAYRRGAASIIALDTSSPVISAAASTRSAATAIPQLVPMLNAMMSKEQRVSSLGAAAAHVPVLYLPTPAGLSGALSFTASLDVARQSYVLASEFLIDLFRHYGDGALAPGLYARPDAFAPISARMSAVLRPVPAAGASTSTDEGGTEGPSAQENQSKLTTQSNHQPVVAGS